MERASPLLVNNRGHQQHYAASNLTSFTWTASSETASNSTSSQDDELAERVKNYSNYDDAARRHRPPPPLPPPLRCAFPADDAGASVNIHRHDRERKTLSLRPTTVSCLKTPTKSQPSIPTPSKLFPKSMCGTVIDAAAHSIEAVRREALKMIYSSTRPTAAGTNNCPALRLVETTTVNSITIDLYHKAHTRWPSTRTRDPTPHQELQRHVPASTRVLGVARLHAPLNEVVNILSPSSALSFALLNPGVASYETQSVLIDTPSHYVAVKWMAMAPRWQVPRIRRQRAFIVVESHQAFQTPDGRRGWAVSFHSLSWPGCIQSPQDAVRASMYNTGIVLLESAPQSELVDVCSVAELKLKGHASVKADYMAARDRALDTLLLLTGTLEMRASSELALLRTNDFDEIQRCTMAADTCFFCADQDDCAKETPVVMHRCRRCCVSVCDDCSALWRRGAKQMRLCVDCLGETTFQF